MSWLKLGEEFAKECAHADLSDAAFRTHIEGLSHAMDRENDGRFDEREVRRFAETNDFAAAVQELVDSGFWTRSNSGELQIVHHIEEQPSAAYFKDQRSNAATRQRRKRELDALTAQGLTKDQAEQILLKRGIPAPKSQGRSQGESQRDNAREETRDPERSGPELNGPELNGPELNRASFDKGTTAKAEPEQSNPDFCAHPDCNFRMSKFLKQEGARYCLPHQQQVA